MSYGCGSCGYSASGGCGYSKLESIAYHSSGDYQSSGQVNYFAEAVAPAPVIYQPQSSSFSAYKNSNETLYQISKNQATNIEYSFVPDQFLQSGRTKRFIGDAEQIQEEIKEAFMKTTGLEMPEDMQISICSVLQFKKMISQPGVMGFSVNRKGFGFSEIFVLNDDLARVMLTIGHEIGHVLSRPLKDKRLEEAKAFAFSKAWMRAIKENNIADLRNAIVLENPAQNGLHDVAHLFVHQKTQETEPLALYWEIVRGEHESVFA